MRKLAIMLLVAVGVFSTGLVNALGLGELKLNSSLNEKLDAEIKLVNIGELSANELIPNLASHDDFARAGIERVFFLTGIHFEVVMAGPGEAVLKLTTDSIVREPFLNFLVELHWPSGRMVREYTVLVDPPIFAERAAVAVKQATAAATSPPKLKSTARTQNNSRARGASEGADQGGTVLVKKDDTLWGIAKANRPENQSLSQAMLAIQRNNPHAFINNNINLLKAGQVLRIPGAAEMVALSRSDAEVEASRQTEAWQRRELVDTTTDERQSDANKASSVDSNVFAGGELQLLSDDVREESAEALAGASGSSVPDSEQRTGGGNGYSNIDAGSLGNEAGTVNNEKVRDLESKLANMERLIELKDQQLALLQASPANTGVDPDPGAKVTPTENESSPVVTTPTNPNSAAATPAEKGLFATILSSPIYMVLLGILVVIGLLLVIGFMKRRNQDDDYVADLQQDFAARDEKLDLPDDFDDGFDEMPVIENDRLDTVSSFSTDNAQDIDDLAQIDDSIEEEDDSTKIIEEVDIYIAYGRYERALDILEPAVAQTPDDATLRLKLAEIAVLQGDNRALADQEARLQAIGDAGILQQLDAIKLKAQSEAMSSSELTQNELETFEKSGPESKEDDVVVAFNPMPDSDAKVSDEPLADQEPLEFSLDDDETYVDTTSEETGTVERAVASEFESGDTDFLGDTDESATKLELARAYIDMADKDSAQDILNEVIEEGSDEQKEEAQKLLATIA